MADPTRSRQEAITQALHMEQNFVGNVRPVRWRDGVFGCEETRCLRRLPARGRLGPVEPSDGDAGGFPGLPRWSEHGDSKLASSRRRPDDNQIAIGAQPEVIV